VGPHAIVIAWGTPESDGGAPIEGYTIAIKDTRKTMWMEVGRVRADVQKLNIKDLQVRKNLYFKWTAKNMPPTRRRWFIKKMNFCITYWILEII
jgi:hypothetical protein